MGIHTDDERTLRQLIADWSAAARRRDYDGVLAHHAENILIFPAADRCYVCASERSEERRVGKEC